MTKKEAIRYRIENMDDDDLINLVCDTNSNDGGYESWVFRRMDEFDDEMYSCTPTEIADIVQYSCGDFSTCDEYFYFDERGVLNSCDEDEAADLIRTDLTYDLVNDFMKGRYSDIAEENDDIMGDIINADDGAIFDSEGYEIID